MSIESILIGGITTLGAVIVFLWKVMQVHVDSQMDEMRQRHNECEKRNDECEEDRGALWDQHVRLLENVYKECSHAERCAARNEVPGGCPVAVPLAAQARETKQMLESAKRRRESLKEARSSREAA